MRVILHACAAFNRRLLSSSVSLSTIYAFPNIMSLILLQELRIFKSQSLDRDFLWGQ